MNRPLKHVVAVLMGLFTILFVQLNRIQFFQAEDLQENSANTRTIQRDFNQERGRILTADEVVIAESDPTPDGSFDYQRVYPQGDLYAHVGGYLSATYGAEGVELKARDYLTGQTPGQEFAGLRNPLDGRDPVADVYLTIDSKLQRTARDALGNRQGAVVVIDPIDGAVKALWSYPSYDPNRMAANDGTLANEAWTELVESPGNPLRSKVYQEIYFPGSTFKVVTAAAALENGLVTLDSPEFPLLDSYTPPLTTRPLRNFSGDSCGGNLVEMLVVSCNTGFAQLGAEVVGPKALSDMAESLGFNSAPEFDLPGVNASKFPTDYGALVQNPTEEIPAGVYENTPLLAQASLGQYDVSATPLQMALVAAAVSNGGDVPRVHVMGEARDPVDGRVTATFGGGKWRDGMSSQTASQLTLAMIEVVERGTARSIAKPGFVIGAKTGTAQLGTDPPRSHAWMIAFAGRPNQPPELAIAALVEGVEGTGDQTGGGEAGPIVKALLDQYFAQADP